jgi:drug/metabolite transporter (DMT)-like permease
MSKPSIGTDRTWLIAIAAGMWGLDGLLRKPLATTMAPATVVFWEHLIVVALVSPLLPRAARVFRSCSWRDRAAVAAIGIGASAVGTALFTEAFTLSAANGDFVTPLVLQKLQPLFAVALAVMLLRERLRPGFAYYAVPALVGAWLLAFAQPLHVRVSAVEVALLALGSAALWAAGTVLGRLVSDAISPRDLTVLRYAWGLPAALVVLWCTHAPVSLGPNVGRDFVGLLLLALIPGLFALVLYYVGLQRTPASRATFAELAFPATAAVVGVWWLDGHLTESQWLGFALIAVAVLGLGWHERGRTPAVVISTERVEFELVPIGADR